MIFELVSKHGPVDIDGRRLLLVNSVDYARLEKTGTQCEVSYGTKRTDGSFMFPSTDVFDLKYYNKIHAVLNFRGIVVGDTNHDAAA